MHRQKGPSQESTSLSFLQFGKFTLVIFFTKAFSDSFDMYCTIIILKTNLLVVGGWNRGCSDIYKRAVAAPALFLLGATCVLQAKIITVFNFEKAWNSAISWFYCLFIQEIQKAKQPLFSVTTILANYRFSFIFFLRKTFPPFFFFFYYF